jgi:DNA-binding MarR family transcriptional regulator
MNPATATGSMSLITRLSRLVFRRATEEVLGMRLKQLIALDYLREHQGTPQKALGQSLMLDPNNCVILLNDLDVHGYIERRRDPEDRRRHLVEITPAGLKALEKAEARMEDLEEEVLCNLSNAERAELHGLLVKALAGQDLS